MTKENQKPEFVLQFLKGFQFAEPKRILEVKAFFSEAFLMHAHENSFDDKDYRVEWVNAINYLNDLSVVIAKFSAIEIDHQIDLALIVLEGKEVTHA